MSRPGRSRMKNYRSGTTTSKRSTQAGRSAGIYIASYILRSFLEKLGNGPNKLDTPPSSFFRQTEKMQELVFNALDTNNSGTISFRFSIENALVPFSSLPGSGCWPCASAGREPTTRSSPGLSGSTTRMAVAALTSRRWISLDSISCHGKAVLKVKRVTRALYSHFSPMTDEETTTRAEVFFFSS